MLDMIESKSRAIVHMPKEVTVSRSHQEKVLTLQSGHNEPGYFEQSHSRRAVIGYVDSSALEFTSMSVEYLTFQTLASQWRSEHNPLSSNAWDNVLIPSYQNIIGMGVVAVPFILQELQAELKKGEPDDWFVALWAITRQNPVPLKDRGKIKEMAKAWIDWGYRQGYLNGEELGARIPAFG